MMTEDYFEGRTQSAYNAGRQVLHQNMLRSGKPETQTKRVVVHQAESDPKRSKEDGLSVVEIKNNTRNLRPRIIHDENAENNQVVKSSNEAKIAGEESGLIRRRRPPPTLILQERLPTEEKKISHLKEIVTKKPIEESSIPIEVFESVHKGKGVRAVKAVKKGQLICEYAGDLISYEEAERRELQYGKNGQGCYLYFFKHKGQTLCVDATEEKKEYGYGRLINHRIRGNLITKKIVVDGQPRLFFFAARDIDPKEELTYDYGDRAPNSIQSFPWLME